MSYSVEIPRNQWVNLYTATGLSVGTRLIIENIGDVDIQLSAEATTPAVTDTDVNVIRRANGVRLANKSGAAGAWAFSKGAPGRLTIMVEDEDFQPYNISSDANGGAVTISSGDVSVDNFNLDAFGRLRSSAPVTLFDSKQLHSNKDKYWDDQEVSGTGTTSTFSADRASSMLAVSATTAGKRIRQTFQRFNYQPGKSQLILMTGVPIYSGGGSGIKSKIGYFDDENGIFFSVEDGTAYLTIRSKKTGSVVDTQVAQSSWNTDTFDGTGASGITLDKTKSQILWIDLEWLGVGSVRTGFVIDGNFITAHKFHHANSIQGVYMSTPNLPCRYELENDGTGAASELEHICTSVISEGGQEPTGELHYVSTDNAGISSGGTLTALLGIRLRADRTDQQIDLSYIDILNTANVVSEWRLLVNPTVAGTFTYVDHEDSSVQIAIGAASNTIADQGLDVLGGLNPGSSRNSVNSADLQNAIRLGSAIDGTPTEMVIAVKTYSGSGNFDAALGWRELT